MLLLPGMNGRKTPCTYAADPWSGWVGELKAEWRAERLWTLVLLWEIPMDEGGTSSAQRPLFIPFVSYSFQLSVWPFVPWIHLGSPPVPSTPYCIDSLRPHATKILLGESPRFWVSSRPRRIRKFVRTVRSTWCFLFRSSVSFPSGSGVVFLSSIPLASSP